jgi:hypothetical protein
MLAINWLNLQPQEAELDALNERLQEALPARKVRQLLIEIILQSYPWQDRGDLIRFFHPSQTYRVGDLIALPVTDPQNLRPAVWQVALVRKAETAANDAQGSFQVITLEVGGKKKQVVGSLVGSEYPLPELSTYSPEDLLWLAEWAADAYAGPVQAVLGALAKSGALAGQFAGDAFIPNQIPSISPARLTPIFDALSPGRPWISEAEIPANLADLSDLKPQVASALLREALSGSPYLSLGGDRWTTPALFAELNREVPRGLPVPHVRSQIEIWTEQDRRDLAHMRRRRLPKDVRQALEELGEGDTIPEPPPEAWTPPAYPVKLPTLNYLHLTQAYFPVGHVIHAFAPDVRLVFVQFIDGERAPFLLDRDNELLKALEPDALRARILEGGIPAGTYLWLEYQGGEDYRIAPRPLTSSRRIPCKIAYLDHGDLRIEQDEIPMYYEGDPSVFKAEMRFEDIQALFAEASRVNLSVRDAIIYAVQELSAADPQNRAHRLEIFNAVFLKRMCSPNSVAVLLYTEPCFERLGEGYFRYNPTAKASRVPTERGRSTGAVIPPPEPPVPDTVSLPQGKADILNIPASDATTTLPAAAAAALPGKEFSPPPLASPKKPVRVQTRKPAHEPDEAKLPGESEGRAPSPAQRSIKTRRSAPARSHVGESVPGLLAPAVDANADRPMEAGQPLQPSKEPAAAVPVLAGETSIPADDRQPPEGISTVKAGATLHSPYPEMEPQPKELSTQDEKRVSLRRRIWIRLRAWWRQILGGHDDRHL